MQLDTMTMAMRLGMSTHKLEHIANKKLPEGKLYVEDNLSTVWHRHVEQHGPKPEAYAAYNIAVIESEERIACLK